MEKIAVLVDGAFMFNRVRSLKAFRYEPAEIAKYCHHHADEDKKIYRIFYYDAAPFSGIGTNPLSKQQIDFSKISVYQKQTELHKGLKIHDFVALRLGHLQWQGNAWKIRHVVSNQILKGKHSTSALVDGQIEPVFEQKGVDMRIGLDIASLAYKRLVDTIVVVTGDQDFIPALKLARKEGLTVGLDTLKVTPNDNLRAHVDFCKTFIEDEEYLQNKAASIAQR